MSGAQPEGKSRPGPRAPSVGRRLQRAACSGTVILAVALALRVAWALLVPVAPVSDSAAYETFARNIAAGHGYGWVPGKLTAYWAVGTSAVYAALFRLFGNGYASIVVLHIGVGVAIVWLAMSLARATLGPRVAVATGWALAVWPLLIEFTTVLASELLFLVCLLAALRVACASRCSRAVRIVGSGVALAAASYVRPTALLLPPFLFLREALTERRWRAAVAGAAGTTAVMLALIVPWSLRNRAVFGEFVLISTNGGANLWMGNNPLSTGEYMKVPAGDHGSEIELNRRLGEIAVEHIREHPGAFVVRTAKKALLLHARETIGVAWNETALREHYGERVLMPMKLLSSGYWWAVLGFGVIGLVGVARRRSWADAVSLPCVSVWVYFTAVHSVIVVGDRYHMASIPFVAMLAGVGVVAVGDRLRGAPRGDDPPEAT